MEDPFKRQLGFQEDQATVIKAKHILLAAIGLLFVFNLYRIQQKDWNYADPIDFRGLYLGGQMLAQGDALYNDSIATQYWLTAKIAEGFASNSDFGDPWISIMLYPPNAFTLTYPLSQMKWKTARILWWGVGLLAFVIAGFVLFRLTNSLWAIGLLLAAKGSFFAFALGQPLLLVFFFLVLSVYWKDKYPILAGIMLGLAMVKFNLAIPFGLWFLFQKHWKLLIAGAATAIVLILPALLSQVDPVQSYLQKVNDYYNMLYNPDMRNIYTFSNSELTIFLDYYWDQLTAVWKQINSAGQLAGYSLFAFLYFKKNWSAAATLIGLCLVSFSFSYHLSYDAVLLILPLMMLKPRWRNPGMWIFLLLSLPWNAAFEELTLIKFNYPLIVFFALILFIFAYQPTHERTPDTAH